MEQTVKKAFGKYPKIFRVGSRYIPDLFNGPVVITEKIDGSQIGFGKIDGELMIRSRGQFIHNDESNGLFGNAINHIKSLEDDLPNNEIFYGECLSKPRHNVLAYSRVPSNFIALYGHIRSDGSYVTSHRELDTTARRMGLEPVPILFEGTIKDEEQLKKLLDTESVLGHTKIEGLVIVNWGKHSAHPHNNMCFGKYVSENFKEIMDTPKSSKEDPLVSLLSSYRSKARWSKAVMRLNEDELLVGGAEDIGKIMQAIHKDLIEEEGEYIKEQALKIIMKKVKHNATDGFPQWYLNSFAKAAFSSGDS